jgi:hypothetical protein
VPTTHDLVLVANEVCRAAGAEPAEVYKAHRNQLDDMPHDARLAELHVAAELAVHNLCAVAADHDGGAHGFGCTIYVNDDHGHMIVADIEDHGITAQPGKNNMKTKHTPGAWTLDGIQNNSQATTSIIVRSSGNASHGNAPYVAEVSWPRDGLRRFESAMTDEDWANARLIAAAPDLLEALKDALDVLRLMGIDMAAFEAHRAAILKAEGGK